MERNTKILLGLAAAGVVAYLVFKPKKKKMLPPSGAVVDCNDGTIVPIMQTENYRGNECIGHGGEKVNPVDNPVVNKPVVNKPVVNKPVVNKPIVDNPVDNNYSKYNDPYYCVFNPDDNGCQPI